MDKELIIEKTVKEYEKYGITWEFVEIIYDLAIIIEVPEEIIYEGMRYQINNYLGIKDETVANSFGKDFMKYISNDTKTDNSTVSSEKVDANIADEILREGLNKLGEKLEGMPSDIKNAIEKHMKQFVKENI